nr:hypothetical protein CFP56_15531 [Quercus suber]
MAEELEEMWKKLSFIEVEDESISLGSRTTEAARNLGKNCLVMKVLSHKSINIDALRKNLRMIWKPQKCIQINEVEDERYLVEFGDGWDKKRIMEMCPWTYEKYLILCGLLSHGLKDCEERNGVEDPLDLSKLQYGAWLRGEAPRRGGGDSTKVGHEEGRANRGWAASKPEGSKTRVTHAPKEGSGVGTEPESTQAPLGTCVIENETRKEGLRGQVTECEHETGKGSCIGEKAKGITTTSGKEGKRGLGTQNEAIEVMQWETGTLHGEANVFEFQMAPTKEGIQNIKAQKVKEHGSGPMALCYKDNIGWVAEHLGPKSGHWKRIKREACEAKPKENMGPGTRKRAGITPIDELDTNIIDMKRKKPLEQNKTLRRKSSTDGGEASFTWCNGRFGEQRTMVRLDRVVADERWIEQFSEAQVRHISMSASDHCLLALFLKKKKPTKPMKKRFFFEAMWVRDGGCREVIESVWGPSQANPNECFTDKITKCQAQLWLWNQTTFGNVNTRLKRLKERLQLIEGQNLLHDTANEI